MNATTTTTNVAKKSNTLYMVELAMMIAIILLMSFTPLGYLRTPVLSIRMNDGEPVQNVPRSIKEEGHQILKLDDNEDGTYTLYVKKVED